MFSFEQKQQIQLIIDTLNIYIQQNPEQDNEIIYNIINDFSKLQPAQLLKDIEPDKTFNYLELLDLADSHLTIALNSVTNLKDMCTQTYIKPLMDNINKHSENKPLPEIDMLHLALLVILSHLPITLASLKNVVLILRDSLKPVRVIQVDPKQT